ncbi:unnamed protein product, partial [marine sediment metagenome]
ASLAQWTAKSADFVFTQGQQLSIILKDSPEFFKKEFEQGVKLAQRQSLLLRSYIKNVPKETVSVFVSVFQNIPAAPQKIVNSYKLIDQKNEQLKLNLKNGTITLVRDLSIQKAQLSLQVSELQKIVSFYKSIDQKNEQLKLNLKNGVNGVLALARDLPGLINQAGNNLVLLEQDLNQLILRTPAALSNQAYQISKKIQDLQRRLALLPSQIKEKQKEISQSIQKAGPLLTQGFQTLVRDLSGQTKNLIVSIPNVILNNSSIIINQTKNLTADIFDSISNLGQKIQDKLG